MLRRLLREPLLHFLLLGASIFLIAALRAAPSARDTASDRIVVTAGDVQHITDAFARTWQRQPTPAEVAGLVDEHVRDEVYYRDALALGLDRDDAVVRRQLRQKMEFVIEDAVAGPPPSDADLQAYLDAHPDDFRREPEVSFRHVYLDRDRRGAHAVDDAGALIVRLARAGPDFDTAALGDAIMLPSDFDHVSVSEVARTFGDEFAAALAAGPVSQWSGPIASGYGLHVVFVRNRTSGRLPALDEVRDEVSRELRAATRKRMVDDAYAARRARYDVVIESAARDAIAAR
jgi:hypothetical protein